MCFGPPGKTQRDKTKLFIPSSKLSHHGRSGSRRLCPRSAGSCEHLLSIYCGPDCLYTSLHLVCTASLSNGLISPTSQLFIHSLIHSLLNLLWRDNSGLETACPPGAYFLAQMEKLGQSHQPAFILGKTKI